MLDLLVDRARIEATTTGLKGLRWVSDLLFRRLPQLAVLVGTTIVGVMSLRLFIELGLTANTQAYTWYCLTARFRYSGVAFLAAG